MSEAIPEDAWGDPPRHRNVGRRSTAWEGRLLAMAERPGEWVNVTVAFGLKPSGGHLIQARAAIARLGLDLTVELTLRQGVTYMRVVKP